MRLSNLRRGELIAMAGSVLLVVSIFLPWYHLGNKFATLYGFHGPDITVSAWQALDIVRWLLIAAAVAPFILTYIIARGHRLSWPRGEVTALVAILALFFVVVRGYFVKPGMPRAEISLSWGWWLSLLAGFVMLVGAGLRRSISDVRRKPPGAL